MNTETVELVMESIGPQKAGEYLRLSFGNRKPRPDWIRTLMREMEGGTWDPRTEQIRFDTNGHLVDGHQRLAAVIKSGCTVDMMVERNFPPEAVIYLDTGAKRTAGDMVGFGAPELASAQNYIAAGARLIFLHERGQTFKGMSGGGSPGKAPTNADILRTVEKYPVLRSAAAEVAPYKRGLQQALLAAKALYPDMPIAEIVPKLGGQPPKGITPSRYAFAQFVATVLPEAIPDERPHWL